MKILITGVSGFVGKHLILQKEAFSNDQIILISRDLEKIRKYESQNVLICEADMSDITSFEKVFSDDIDLIINLAAEVRNSQNFTKTNINGVENLVKLAHKYNVPKIIHLSSVGVVGAQYNLNKTVVFEDAKCFPKNGYEVSKLESEKIFKANFQGNLIILRPTNVYGEYHPFNALLNLMNRIKRGKPLPYTSSAVVNYVYVKDLVEVILHFKEKEINSLTVNVGKSHNLNEFYKLLESNLGHECLHLKIPKIFVWFLSKIKLNKLKSISNETAFDDGELLHHINYKYDYSNGIKNTVDYYKDQNLL